MTWSSCFTVKCLSAVSGSGLGIIVCSKFLNSYYISGLKIVVLVCSISGFNETPSFTNLAPPTAISVSRIPPFILFSDVRVARWPNREFLSPKVSLLRCYRGLKRPTFPLGGILKSTLLSLLAAAMISGLLSKENEGRVDYALWNIVLYKVAWRPSRGADALSPSKREFMEKPVWFGSNLISGLSVVAPVAKSIEFQRAPGCMIVLYISFGIRPLNGVNPNIKSLLFCAVVLEWNGP